MTFSGAESADSVFDAVVRFVICPCIAHKRRFLGEVPTLGWSPAQGLSAVLWRRICHTDKVATRG